MREIVADLSVAGYMLGLGGMISARAQPCLPEWETTGGPSPEPGEGSKCQTHLELMVTGALVAALRLMSTRLCPGGGTHSDVTFPKQY